MPPISPAILSNVSGYMSIALWVVVYSPQIWENYCLSSGEGLSVPFIVLWLLGDLTNLWGACLAGLLPTVIILAVYYTISDVILLLQVYYYRRFPSAQAHAHISPSDESTPLLPEPRQPKPLLPPSLEYPALLAFVLLSGAGAWYLTDKDEVHVPVEPDVTLEWKSQTLGWLSAVLYLGSRIPQIVHNYKTRCAGLSLAMFFFAISGNITYVLSILLKSLNPRWILANLPWLAGSGLTVFLDLFVLGQFAVFSWQDKQKEKVFVEEAEEEEEEQV
ncbi:hypothetical protein L198_00828 [Cryptococcus wingfieldii CBS 7118]|uniref:Vacuolar membrane protein n=1 Tax=Cryptococcus wingfieldii CBS 7118 TaxID=1295528 RepID=A0A1E3K2L1_9TREE|nr:hypothetical protein L198_00828 [Cryptococcus wingfieldii CBS 7118]ODO07249.1 hypothetical protein L198_00828 [Cryptococcus wingfieldii CBS 7118]